LNSYGLPEG
jgi:hypothetical protein